MDRHTLCEFLLREKLITGLRLEEALAEERRAQTPVRLLALLVERGDVSEAALAHALSRRLSVPWVRAALLEPGVGVLKLVPRDAAERFSLFPVYVRRDPMAASTLYVAMDDPTWEEALLTVSVMAGMPVRPLLATRSQIAAAIAHHFGSRPSSRPTQPAEPVDADGRPSLEPPARRRPPALPRHV